MDQEIPQKYEPQKVEEEVFIANQDHYFFDMNFMILPDILDKITLELKINPEVISSQQYQEERERLLFTMLKYDIGLDILIKLVYRRDQSPLNGYYYLKTLDDMAFIIFNMQYRLLDLAIQQYECYKQISNRILKLFNSILNRKKKEIQKFPHSNIAQKDLENLQQKYNKVNDINCLLKNYEFYRQNWITILEYLNNPQYKLLQKVILYKTEIQQKVQENCEIQVLLMMSELTIYQQELIITYIQSTQEIQDVDCIVRGKYRNLYEGIFLMDTNLQGEFEKIVKLMMLYYFEIENWKLLVIENLMELNQEQDAYELLLASKIDWNCLSNSDIIIKLLIASKRSLQAYVYVTELKNEQALKYFVKQMLIQQEILNLLQIEFTPDQDNIVNEIIKNLADKQVLIEFVKKLLRTRKYQQAIEFYQKLSEGPFQLGMDTIEQLIKKRISQLPKVEEDYYLAKMQGKQLNEDELLIEAILDTQDKSIEQTNQGQRSIKYFVEQPILDYERIINCCGWIRENHLGIIF